MELFDEYWPPGGIHKPYSKKYGRPEKVIVKKDKFEAILIDGPETINYDFL